MLIILNEKSDIFLKDIYGVSNAFANQILNILFHKILVW